MRPAVTSRSAGLWPAGPPPSRRTSRRDGGVPRLVIALALFLATAARLPTGATLDPAAKTSPVGNFPLAMALSPDGDRVALLLNGQRQQGVQILDRHGAVLQTLDQPAAFIGLDFSADGHALWASGGYEDALYRYRWSGGRAELDRRVQLDPMAKKGTHYPAGLAFSPDGSRVYVAENLSDTVAVVDTGSDSVVQRLRVDRYPFGVAVSRTGDVYVTSWGDDSVTRFVWRDGRLVRERRIAVGRHPSSMLLDDVHGRLFVTCASIDRIVIVSTKTGAIVGHLDDAPPGVREGSTPNALALSKDGGLLFVAEADNNAIAVFNVASKKLLGRIPVEWYPTAVAVSGGDLITISAKGSGTAPNPTFVQPDKTRPKKSTTYALGQLNGSFMRVPARLGKAKLAALTARVAAANGWTSERRATPADRFKHVIYIIKENRTYDQVLGDLPGADGDPALVFFPRPVSPNHHALAERFGIFDRFFANAEVSAQGHNWSTAAYATDYTEKTTPAQYADHGRAYDYQGMNRDVIVDEDDDVASPSAGYLWNLALRKKIAFRDYGEFVVSAKDVGDDNGTGFVETREALRDHVNLDYPPYDLDIPDQRRADVWIADLQKFVERGEMPALQMLWLPNDHTAGAKAGKPAPRVYMADNDLALGRIVEALTYSPFWKDTVVFVVEDDAQSGPDHVDSHRSVLLVISPYSRGGVMHRFTNTTDVLATIEEILGLGSMSQFDHYGRPLHDVFSSEADLRPYDALTPSVDRNEKNPADTEAAKQSMLLDLSRPDAADDARFNEILWRAIKGDLPMPPPVRAPAGAMGE